jgi:hypothetical protein
MILKNHNPVFTNSRIRNFKFILPLQNHKPVFIKLEVHDYLRSPKQRDMSWEHAEETLLAGIGDRCNGYQWLHTKSQRHYEIWNVCLTIPSIVLSAITGSVTIGLSSLFPRGDQTIATTILGSVTIGSGILTTINQYMKTSSLAEAHRSAALAYGKLYRLILTELSLKKGQRVEVKAFLKMVRAEQDRLQDMCPTISACIISEFNATFKNNTLLEKPEIVGDLDHIVVSMEVPLLGSGSGSPDSLSLSTST